jgi:hypothetical protein
MMKQTVKKHKAFLNFLVWADSTQQKVVVKNLTSEQYDVLSEIALNIYTGTYPLAKKYINQLKPYESCIRSLGSREVSNREKRRILLKNISLIPLLLKPIVQHLIGKWQRK